ncbi:Protein INX-16 [Aphelenchoides avenae]|nr:Protein INX-16 [Aphelenchus avenae]
MAVAAEARRLRDATDLVDKVNYVFLPCVLLALAATSAIVLKATSVQCEMPTNFTRETEAFVREVCQDPKYLVNSEEASSSCMSDFTWLPFRLVLQALFFFAPVCIWKRNYDAPAAVRRPDTSDDDVIEALVDELVVKLNDGKNHCRDRVRYLLMKTGFMVNLLVQSGMVGIEVWNTDEAIPLEAFCRMPLLEDNVWNVKYLPCDIQINLVVRALYVLLSCLLFFTAFATTMNGIFWFVNLLSSSQRYDFVKSLLNTESLIDRSEEAVREFVDANVSLDILQRLRLLNASDRRLAERVGQRLFEASQMPL